MKFRFLFCLFLVSVAPLISFAAEQNSFAQTLLNKYLEEEQLKTTLLPTLPEDLINQFIQNFLDLGKESDKLCDTEDKKQLRESALTLITFYLPIASRLSGNSSENEKFLSIFNDHLTFLFDQYEAITQSDKEKIVELDIKILACMTMTQNIPPLLRSMDDTQKEKIVSMLQEQIHTNGSKASNILHGLLATVNFTRVNFSSMDFAGSCSA